METVVNSKVLQLTATMAQTVSHKRMAWYDQLVGLVLRNLASLVVAKQPGNRRLGMVGLVLHNLTDAVMEQPGSSLEGMALAEFILQQAKWSVTDVVMLAT